MADSNSIICPSCKVGTTLLKRASEDPVGGALVIYEIGECNNCSQHFLVERLMLNGNIMKIYPSAIPKKVTDDLPPQIKKDFEEALIDESIGSHRSAVTMARRALQGICLDQGAPSMRTITSKGKPIEIKNDLSRQIDWLLSEQIITKPLRSMAHEVRSVGNDGAHPEDAEDDTEISPEDSAEIMALLDAFAQTLYIGPSILKKRIKSRT